MYKTNKNSTLEKYKHIAGQKDSVSGRKLNFATSKVVFAFLLEIEKPLRVR